MRHLYTPLLAAVFWAAAVAASFPAEPVVRCKLELVQRAPLPDNWQEAKKLFMFDCVDCQTFYRGTQDGITFVRSKNNFEEVVKKEPKKYIAKRPLRGVTILGSQQYAFVLDHKSNESTGYDRLYFDLNGNGDLTDDKPLDVTPNKKQTSSSTISDNSEFPRVMVSVDVAGRKIDYPLSLRRQYVRKPDYEYIRLFLTVEAYRRAEITLDGKRHAIAVLDWNSNGRFDDVLSVPQHPPGSNDRLYPKCGDVLLIDPEKTATENLSWARPLGEHRQFLGALTVLEGKYYHVKVSPSGDEITWTPAAVPCGQVASPHAPCHVELIGEMGYFDLNLEKSKPTTIPAGRWQLFSYGITVDNWKEPEKKDSKAPESKPSAPLEPVRGPANRSHLSATGTTNSSPVVVKPGQTTTLTFGPPYKTSVELERWQETTSLLLVLHGADSEVVDGLTVNGRSPDKPTFSVTDPNGKIVAAGSFEYG
jgi:hypothetical protein